MQKVEEVRQKAAQTSPNVTRTETVAHPLHTAASTGLATVSDSRHNDPTKLLPL